MKEWKIQATLRLVQAGKAFGPGVAALMEGVQQFGSLRRSAKEMGMSYNKAWHVVRECEENLGYPLMIRHIGGAQGGGAILTPEGERLLQCYRTFEQEAKAQLDQLAKKYFGEMLSYE